MLFRTLLDDLGLTLRHARRAKAFYASAVLTLALGIAGATVMFTLVRGILLRPLPVPDEDRLVVSWRVPRSGLATHVPYRSADVEEIGRASRSFEKTTAVGYNGAFEQDWRLRDSWVTVKTVAVMGGFFDVAGVQPQIGRVLTVEDDRRGAERLVVLSHGAWVRLFGAAPNAIGQTLRLHNRAFRVAGVMPADFEYPSGSELWTTLNALADIDPNEAFRTGMLRDVELLGRLRPGVTVAQATDELAAMMSDLDVRVPGADFVNFRPIVRPLCRDSPPRDRRPTRSPSIPRSTSRPSFRRTSRPSAWRSSVGGHSAPPTGTMRPVWRSSAMPWLPPRGQAKSPSGSDSSSETSTHLRSGGPWLAWQERHDTASSSRLGQRYMFRPSS